MSTNLNPSILNNSPYIRTSRDFPEDPHQLSVELERTYLDLASFINFRTIGLFTPNRPTIGGESWYLSGQSRQQNLRQIYRFSDSSLTINHGINFSSLTNFVRIWGTFFDGTNWNTLPYVDVTAANNQINIVVNSTQIVVTKGGGSPPSISNGLIILEWISNP